MRDLIWKDLVKQIASGELRPGQQLPTEKDLERKYGVSRTPVREALSRLALDGLIDRRPGSGTFVSGTPIHSVHVRHSPFSFYYDTDLNKISVETLNARMVSPPPDVMKALRISGNSDVVYIERVRKLDSKPVSFLMCWFREGIPIEPFIANKAFFRVSDLLYEAIGVKCSQGLDTIDAIVPSRRERDLLQIAQNTPVLRTTRILLDLNGEAVAYYFLLADSAVWKYRATLSF